MSSGMFCGLTPITFCRKLSRSQIARGVALKKLIKGKHEFRRSSTSKKNVEKKKNKEMKRSVSQISSSVVEASPKSLNSTKEVSTLSDKNENKKENNNTNRNNDLEGSSPKCTASFILMVELRKNIFAFRDMIDLPSLDGSLSVTEIIMQTMKDLQKLSPEIVTINQSFKMEGAEMDKILIYFYEDLRAIGDSWIMDNDWIYRSKYKNSEVGKNKSDRLVEHVLAALDGLIKMTRERFGMMDIESDGRKSFTSKGYVSSEPRISLTRSVSYSDSNNSFYQSPLTPTSVLPTTMMISTSNVTSPSVWNMRAQALDKLSPVDLKRLAMRILSHTDSETVLDPLKNGIIEENEESEKLTENEQEDSDSSVSGTEETEDHVKCSETEHHNQVYETEYYNEAYETDHEIETEHHNEAYETKHYNEAHETEHEAETEHETETEQTETEDHSKAYETEHETETEDHNEDCETEHETKTEHATKSRESSKEEVSVTQLPPPPPMVSFFNKKVTSLSTPPPPPPSSPQPESNSPAPPPPPPPSKTHESKDFCQFPTTKTPAPPAPPGSGKTLRGKKATSKLRRSAQIANLYWVLKGKLEGRGVEGKTTKQSKGQSNVAENSPVKGVRSGMADALAEMTKRSSYFQQIEEDVHKYAKSIEELKSSIHNFQTKDMKELLEFHSKVESVLEKLTDETQVLARLEGFPEKKLEVIRTAGALYKKLNGILVELKNWKIEPPLNELLDKIERYFNKVKGDIETVDRTKEEEAKMFQRHNINIDFQVLVQVKETMVDISSNCMELALKERREANEEKNNEEISKMNNMKVERGKRLWRAFQFAFKVYTFAGGLDERADHLTRQLAHEIQTDPDQTESSIVS